jgi:hypothetical protein
MTVRGPVFARVTFDRPSTHCYDFHAGWSSLVARWAHNPKVGGSNPPPATKHLFTPQRFPVLENRNRFEK